MTNGEFYLRTAHPEIEDRIGGLVSAIGNSEGKAILLVAMKPTVVYSSTDLHRLFMGTHTGREGWRPTHTVPSQWCERSLAPIGLVSREVFASDINAFGYELTEYGEDEGKALAGHLLALSERHDGTSLYQLFGATSASSKDSDDQTSRLRAPITRIRIFQEIESQAAALPVRAVDIGDSLLERYPHDYPNSHALADHFVSLGASGLIDYERTLPDQPIATYIYRGDGSETQGLPKMRDRQLAARLWEIVQQMPNREINIPMLQELLGEQYPEYKTHKNLGTHIASALRTLTRRGFLDSGIFTVTHRSLIDLLPAQFAVVRDVNTVIEQFVSGDPTVITQGKILADEILSDSSRVSRLLRKAKEASPGVNRINRREVSQQILTIIGEFPGCTSRQIHAMLSETYGVQVDMEQINRIIKTYLKTNVVVQREKGQNKFTVEATIS